eukprot:1393042-Amorphochlora_amoeboformis.AAC.1
MVKGETRGYPYAEVSGVTQNQQCCCCWSITGLHENVAPGYTWCFEEQFVKTFVKVEDGYCSQAKWYLLHLAHSLTKSVAMLETKLGKMLLCLMSQPIAPGSPCCCEGKLVKAFLK